MNEEPGIAGLFCVRFRPYHPVTPVTRAPERGVDRARHPADPLVLSLPKDERGLPRTIEANAIRPPPPSKGEGWGEGVPPPTENP